MYYGIVNNAKASKRYWLGIAFFFALFFLFLTVYNFSQGVGRTYFFNEWVYKLASLLPKINGPVTNSNAIGFFMAISIPLLLGFTVFKQRRWIRNLSIALLLLFGIIAFFNGSGGGWLSTIPAIIFVIACWQIRSLIITMPAIDLSAWAFFNCWRSSNLLSTAFPLSSVDIRLDLWEETIRVLKSFWITGLGLGNWYIGSICFLGDECQTITNPHNAYLQVYSDTGIFGGIAMIMAGLFFIFLVWKILHFANKGYLYGIAVGICGGIIAGAFNAFVEVNTASTLFDNNSVIIFYIALPFVWILAALLVVVYENIKNEALNEFGVNP